MQILNTDVPKKEVKKCKTDLTNTLFLEKFFLLILLKLGKHVTIFMELKERLSGRMSTFTVIVYEHILEIKKILNFLNN